jgi:parallel beta-helix repeat protein
MKKFLTASISLLFIGMVVISSSATEINLIKPTAVSFEGSKLYVGGSGEENYTRIQDAIDNTSNGDTVFVYDELSPYYENIVIDKSIILQGENKNTTIIDGNYNDDVVYISADFVHLCDFTIINSGENNFDVGIEIISDFNTIFHNCIFDNEGDNLVSGGILINSSSNNTIHLNKIYSNNYDGISIINSKGNYIHNNEIFENKRLGITLTNSSNNIIENNEVYENYCGICLYPNSTYNIVKNNNIYNHPCCGIALKQFSNYNTIQYNLVIDNLAHGIMLGPGPTMKNTVEMNTVSGILPSPLFPNAAIVLKNALFNTIKKNNIIDNYRKVILDSSFCNFWWNNYWDRYLDFGPKIIIGWAYFPFKLNIIIPWFNFDLYPAKEPHDING